nr:MAG TPA: hypothetical protein [Caudoviricetes sp.]
MVGQFGYENSTCSNLQALLLLRIRKPPSFEMMVV